jgi:nitroimidazol reductase NimA-like FMN-containing flavoprotein (pyridoxamine 5'-phosphate oxidase superfamily)
VVGGLMELSEIRDESRRFGPIAFIATASRDGEPHVAPVQINWVGDELYSFVRSSARKVRNVLENPRAAVHFSVSAGTQWDSVIVWGDASLVDTVEGREALWDKMGYDLAPFEPGGPESDGHLFLRVTPTRAVVLRQYGLAGRHTWRG